MNRVVVLLSLGVFGLLAGCGDGGIEFNGVKQVEQFPVRKTPIVHYTLPSEVIDPVTGEASVDVTQFTTINLQYTDFTEQPSPGNDLFLMSMYPGLPGNPGWFPCTDNPTCPTPAPVIDWVYTAGLMGGSAWPDPSVTSTGIAPHLYLAAWTLSLQNQWFLREVNGSVIVPAVVGNPPVRYESVDLSSMRISIIEGSQGTTPESTLAFAAQREAIQIVVPASNVIPYAYNGLGAPAGMRAAAWQESPAKNIFIENDLNTLVSVPVPPYFGAGGPINAGGGVYHGRYILDFQQTTSGSNPTIDPEDGVQYSYYLAVLGNHLVGYSVGLVDSAFAAPGVIKNQEDIMNQSVVLDLTAFIAAGKEFQFVLEDLVRMQDVSAGDWMNPGPLSTLPGTFR